MESKFSQPIWTAQIAAEFFSCSVQAVYDMRDNGVLDQLTKLPGVRFNRDQCLAAGNYKKDPYERERILAENRQLKARNKELEEILYKIGSEAMGKLLQGGEKR